MNKVKTMLTNPTLTKNYLMTAGTILPATVAVVAWSLYKKESIDMKSKKYLMIFAGALVVGGLITSIMIKGNTVDIPVETPAE